MSRVLPILFNTEMVTAILDERKTVTRRVVKTKSKNACGFYVTTRKSDGAFMGVYDYDENEMMFESPQTQPAYIGDILYVRETWFKDVNRYMYKADYYSEEKFYKNGKEIVMRWKPSIHMPKEAARIFLKVTDVRVERLQDMTLNDFLNEGISIPYEAFNDPDNAYMQSKKRFIYIWNPTINKKQFDLYGWDANPWVWVIKFEKCERPKVW